MPTEREKPTVGVVIKVPEGISFLLVESTPGWKAQVVRRNDRIDEIHWTGGSIPPDFFGTFRFIARNPVAEGELAWRILQQYEGGETVRWIGGPDSASPASRTAITESAEPIDVVNVVSGTRSRPATATTPAATTPATTTPAAAESDEGGDGLALVLAIVGVLAALAALGVALAAWRTVRARPQAADAA